MDRRNAEQLQEFDILPPHSIEAEMCLVASLMMSGADPAERMQMLAAIQPADFYQADHTIIWRTLGEMDGRGESIDAVTLRESLKRQGVLDEVGGAAYIGQLLYSVPSPAHWRGYADTVRDTAIKRALLATADKLRKAVYAPTREHNGAEIAEKLVQQASRIIQGKAACEFKTIGALMEDVLADLKQGGEPAVLTGFRDLDAEMGGIRFGEMCLVAARPSMGKSTFVRQVALNAAMAGVPTAIISLEEGDKKIARNLLSNLSEIDNRRLRGANIHEEEWRQIEHGVQQAEFLPLYIIDHARRIEDIRAATSVLTARHGVKLIVVDYLQRILCQFKEEYDQVSYVSQAMSELIKETNVAGIAVVQPNRGNEKRDEKRLVMSDLRGSGKIEQDADAILMLHREDYYHSREANYVPDHKAELNIAKMRDGARGKTIFFETDMRYQKFLDCEQPSGIMESYL